MPDQLAILDLDYSVVGGALLLYAGAVDVSGHNPGSSGIWHSLDGGTSWHQMAIELVDVKTNAGLTPADIGWINLAIDHASGAPNGRYVAITNGPAFRLMNIFKLADSSWLPVGYHGLAAINTYSAQSLGLAPSGAVYIGGVNDARQNGLYQSVDHPGEIIRRDRARGRA